MTSRGPVVNSHPATSTTLSEPDPQVLSLAGEGLCGADAGPC